jgi:hypothetical protein
MMVVLAGLPTKLQDFIRKRRNKHQTMFPIPIPHSPTSESENEDQYHDWWERDEEPVEGALEPLVERLTREDYNPQLLSPLFNGRIPPEVRNRIFEYVLTEDEDIQYNQDTHYTRPGYGSHKSLLTNLLQTCRRVYLEAHHLPLINREHVFWHHREPEGTGYENEARYFSRFQPDQLALVRKVHLFTQQFWLEGSLQSVCKLSVMQTIEKMTITLRRGDWWYWETGNALGINPQRGEANSHLMRADWGREAAGHVIPWNENAWGCSFKHLKNLQELEMEFETTVYEEKQLQEITEHAKTWRFPMGEGKVLSAKGQNVHRSAWRGPKCVWSDKCEGCGQYGDRTIDCKVCQERKESKKKGLGPNLVVLSLRWKLAADAWGN